MHFLADQQNEGEEKYIEQNLPLNLLARVLSTAANFPIDSLVFLSNDVFDILANLVSKLYEQHVPVDGVSQYFNLPAK